MARHLEHLEPCKLEKVLGLAEAEAKAKVEEKEEEKEKVRKEEKERKVEEKVKEKETKEKEKGLEEPFVEFVIRKDFGETNVLTDTQSGMWKLKSNTIHQTRNSILSRMSWKPEVSDKLQL